MEMADLPHRLHGNRPQRCNTLSAREAEMGPKTAAAVELSWVCEWEAHQVRGLPSQSAAALLRRLRIHPQAQRILGNSVAVVALERLRFLRPSFLQPVVSLVRLPCRTLANSWPGLPQQVGRGGSVGAMATGMRGEDDADVRPTQNGGRWDEADVLEAPEPCDPRSVSPAASWTEPYCPDSSSPGEPEQDSGFDCDSNPDHPYILFDSGSDEWDPDGRTDSETFYLDPDPEMSVVIELNPEPVVDQEPLVNQEPVVDEDPVVDQEPLPQQQESELGCVDVEEEEEPRLPTPEPDREEPQGGVACQEVESEDFCAVCVNGGELLCCDCCPKVYHLSCHIPPLRCFPLGDWVCTLCRSDHEPTQAYECENPCGGVEAPYTLSQQDQRRCERLTLLMCCNPLSAPFHEPVSPLARNYYQVIRRPVDLSLIRRKLDKSVTLHYFTAAQFVDDVLLMFKNCATFNYPDSEVALAGRNLEAFFLSKLREMFPDRTFASASRERTERTGVQWISRRRRKEKNRRKRYVFSGKKYYL